MNRRTLIFSFLLAWVPGFAAAGFSHAEWTGVLERFVDNQGLVDYAGLSRDRGALDRYLASLASSSPDSSPSQFPARDDQLAYWLNAYNALVIAGVLERGVDTMSVWGDGLFGIGFFTVERGTLGGRRWSLKHLEDDVVRDRFRDPRIHAALNCASVSCPRLMRRAFDGATLQKDLAAAMTEFVADERNCRFDAATRTVRLSKIFDWFTRDFVGFEKAMGTSTPTVLDYVNRYRAQGERVPTDSRLKFFEYDKRLNRQGVKP